MLFSVAIVTPNDNHIQSGTLHNILKNTESDYDLVIVDNGAGLEYNQGLDYIPPQLKNVTKIDNTYNVGIPMAYNQAWRAAKGDFIAILHNDLLIYEDGWDIKVRKYCNDNIGIIGFGGATGIGTDDIYRSSYRVDQLIRIGFMSNMVNAEAHGKRMTTEWEPIVVLDGYILILNRKFLEVNNGFSDDFGFWMYDNNICLESIKAGYKNIVVNVSCEHKDGGRGNSAIYDKDNNPPSEAFPLAHIRFYERWRSFLPVRVRV
jgi:GT2 family glycosyltransferase